MVQQWPRRLTCLDLRQCSFHAHDLRNEKLRCDTLALPHPLALPPLPTHQRLQVMQLPRRRDEATGDRTDALRQNGQALLGERVQKTDERLWVDVRTGEADGGLDLTLRENVDDHVRWGGGGHVGGSKGGGHARGYAEGEGDERVGVHGYGAEGRESRAVEAVWVGAVVSMRGVVGMGNGRVHERGDDGHGLSRVSEEST